MVWKRTESESQEPTAYSPRPPADATPPGSRKERAVIGSTISVQGDITGEEDLTILGRIQGTVDVKGNSVTIGSTGHVKADVHAATIVVEGEVEGNLYGGDQIILKSSGHVRGNLTAPRVALEDGGQFKGAIDMEPKRTNGSPSLAAGSSTGSKPADRKGSEAPAGAASGSGAKASSGNEKAASEAGG
ncbi:MAG: polymer-forming cytoskeletal protein [Thermoanaerobaculia bacterium]